MCSLVLVLSLGPLPLATTARPHLLSLLATAVKTRSTATCTSPAPARWPLLPRPASPLRRPRLLLRRRRASSLRWDASSVKKKRFVLLFSIYSSSTSRRKWEAYVPTFHFASFGEISTLMSTLEFWYLAYSTTIPHCMASITTNLRRYLTSL